MLKLVLDTNTFVSAFFWEGNEAKLFKKIEGGKAKLFITKEILREVEEVINREKFKNIMIRTNQKPDHIIQKIILVSHLVIGPKLNIDVCRDPDDNKFLECAVNVNADYIVSGDNDLLVLETYKDIKIVRSSDVLDKI